MKNPIGSGLSLFLSIAFASGLASAQAAGTAATDAAATAPTGSAPTATNAPSVTSEPTGDATKAVSAESVASDSAVSANATANAQAKAEAPAPDEKGDKGGDKDEDKDDDNGKVPWKAKPKIKVGGLVHSQFQLNTAPTDADYDFRLANARVFLEWKQGKLIDGVGEVELSRDGDRNATAWAPMRDAYVRVSPLKELRFRLGQFKRPYGQLALTSLPNLKLIRRGISHVWINEELEYGERDVGFQVEGTIGDYYALHYAVGVFNGPGRNRRDNDLNGAKDFVGRIEGRLGKILTIGVNSANKHWDQAVYPQRPKSAWMSGADILVEYAGLYGLIEGQYGSNYVSIDQRHMGSLLAMAAYKIPLTDAWKVALEPLVKGEILKTETEVRDQYILNGTAGANLYIGKIFRLMVQGEWIEPKGAIPDRLGEATAQKRLIFQAGLYTP